jgi:hypothetical protein
VAALNLTRKNILNPEMAMNSSPSPHDDQWHSPFEDLLHGQANHPESGGSESAAHPADPAPGTPEQDPAHAPSDPGHDAHDHHLDQHPDADAHPADHGPAPAEPEMRFYDSWEAMSADLDANPDHAAANIFVRGMPLAGDPAGHALTDLYKHEAEAAKEELVDYQHHLAQMEHDKAEDARFHAGLEHQAADYHLGEADHLRHAAEGTDSIHQAVDYAEQSADHAAGAAAHEAAAHDCMDSAAEHDQLSLQHDQDAQHHSDSL